MEATEGKEYLYRFENHNVSNGYDEYDNPYPGHTVALYCSKYEILKHTPKGEWIVLYWDGYIFDGTIVPVKRFVLRNAHKRFACPTKEEALDSFISRKKRQIRILTGKIEDAEMAIQKATYDRRYYL